MQTIGINGLHRTLFFIAIIYAAHTVPFYFITFSFPIILRAEGSSLTMIGLLGLFMLPWAFKFLWAPWIDRLYITRLGKRKSWIISMQLLMILALSILALVQFDLKDVSLFLILFTLSTIAATHAIASGAFVIEQLPTALRHWGNYAQVIGTTLGSACGGAIILLCYSLLGWSATIGFITFLSLIFLLIMVNSKEKTSIQEQTNAIPSLRDCLLRVEMRYMLYLCLIYRACEGLIMGMQQPFLVDNQIPIDTIGIVMGIGNLSLGLFAAGIASYLLKSVGKIRMLILLGLLRLATYTSLSLIAYMEIHSSNLIFTVVLINMATRLMEMVTLYTIFMETCSSHQAATDYSILICSELMIYMLGMSLSGYLATYFSYAGLFFIGTILSVPSVYISIMLLQKIPVIARRGAYKHSHS